MSALSITATFSPTGATYSGLLAQSSINCGSITDIHLGAVIAGTRRSRSRCATIGQIQLILLAVVTSLAFITFMVPGAAVRAESSRDSCEPH
jgi:hypothetical protein